MNPPLRTNEPGRNSAASISDRQPDTRQGPEDEPQSAFLPEAGNTVLQSNGFFGSAMKWLADVFADVG